MLDLSGDTTCDIEFRTYGYTGLPDLPVVFTKSGIYGCTAGSDFCMKFLSQFKQHIEALFRAHSITSGYDDRRSFQVMFCLFYMAVDYLNHIICFRNVFSYIVVNDFTRIVGIEYLFLHHPFAYGGHLRAMFRIDDRSYDITSKSRTDLVEQILVGLTGFLIFVRTDFERGTICGQATGQCRRDTRT